MHITQKVKNEKTPYLLSFNTWKYHPTFYKKTTTKVSASPEIYRCMIAYSPGDKPIQRLTLYHHLMSCSQ